MGVPFVVVDYTDRFGVTQLADGPYIVKSLRQSTLTKFKAWEKKNGNGITSAHTARVAHLTSGLVGSRGRTSAPAPTVDSLNNMLGM